jgi:hypothetical protein
MGKVPSRKAGDFLFILIRDFGYGYGAFFLLYIGESRFFSDACSADKEGFSRMSWMVIAHHLFPCGGFTSPEFKYLIHGRFFRHAKLGSGTALRLDF